MAPQHWQHVKAILGEALEHDEGEERDTYVAQTCAHDPSLRREVETYLSFSDEKIEACAENTRHSLFNKIWAIPAGRRFGAYQIVREIGHGGMGTIFLAMRADGQFEKEVAIKLLKRGTDTDEIVRRFRAERQILARLEHSSIARLLDAGTTEDGLPYFVMEYVPGIPITEFVRAGKLTVRQRLELFLQVCSAVERAHSHHIVHRDLKPGNILVTSAGEPKLLDFGIAKLLASGEDALEITATNQQRLTPTCASPEQARGEAVTPASDIYALGSLLYEILTDKRPHEFSTLRPSSEELARVLCEVEPPPPSSIAASRDVGRQLKGDLDNIVMYALRKEPGRRYPSVKEFAEDIRRHIAAQPVQARPNTAAYRTQRFLARHKGAVLQASVGAILLCVGATAFLYKNANLGSHSSNSASGRDASLPIAGKSVAVLPFDSFNKEKDSSYFVDGVQDDILTDLAMASDLKVISRTGVARYRGADKNVREIGRALGVAYVVEGSVQRSAGRVRVNVQLIDTRTDTQVWAEHYERNVDDLFALQSELSQTIVAQLKANLSPAAKAAIENTPTHDMKAYDLYLQARDEFTRFDGERGANWKKGVELLGLAIQRDPKFTMAYCLQSQMNILLYRYIDHTPERLAIAREEAATALRLEPDSGDAHLAQASYYYHGLRDYPRVEQELQLAAPTVSGKAEFLSIAEVTERRLGHWKDAVRDGEKAHALDPHDGVYATTLMESYVALRRFADADKIAAETIAQLPADSTSLLWFDRANAALAAGELDRIASLVAAAPKKASWKDFMLAMVAYCQRDNQKAAQLLGDITSRQGIDYTDWLLEGQVRQGLGESEKARVAFEHARQLIENSLHARPDDGVLLGYLAVTYAELGRRADAITVGSKAAAAVPISKDAIDGPSVRVLLAEVYALADERDAALKELGAIADVPNGIDIGDLQFNPVWDSLRQDSRFAELLKVAAMPPRYE